MIEIIVDKWLPRNNVSNWRLAGIIFLFEKAPTIRLLYLIIHIFTNTTKIVDTGQAFVSLRKYYKRYYTLNILYIFAY